MPGFGRLQNIGHLSIDKSFGSVECDILEESKKTLIIFLAGREGSEWVEDLNLPLPSQSLNWLQTGY